MINRQSANKYNNGFTLIETIIYLALFGMLFNGILISAYTLITAAEHISQQIAVENESAFVIRKINTLLKSANSVVKPTLGTSGDSLSFSTYSGDKYVVTISEGAVTLAKNGEVAVPLTSERTAFNTFFAKHGAAANGIPRHIEYSFTVDDKPVGPIRNYFIF